MPNRKLLIGMSAAAAIVAALAYRQFAPHGDAAAQAAQPPAKAQSADAVDLSDTQSKAIEIGKVEERDFIPRRSAVGSIDFNENLAVQVFTPYQGKIIKTFAEVGDQVEKGKILYTVDSPDLVQAESALIAAAGVYELTSKALARAKDLNRDDGLADKDLQQTISDQQTAEGALKAARDAVRVFGKSDGEIADIVAKRKIDPELAVRSPIAGRVIARAAQPGLLVQPGNTPPPYSVADLSIMWMIANVAESDSPSFHAGQDVRVKVMAYPGREFSARVAVVGASVDSVTHTVTVRSDVKDPKHELRAGMFATYDIRTDDKVRALAIPADGAVREGDGSMSVWVTADHHHFQRRTVHIGMREDGFVQVMDGLRSGEQVAAKGAVFLSNMQNASPD